MTWRPKNLEEANIPVTILFAILGHTPFQYPIGEPKILISIIYTIITGCLYYTALVHSFIAVEAGKGEKIYFFVTVFNIVIAGLSQFLSWYHSKTFFRLATRLMKVDETLLKLGASFNYDKNMRLAINVIILWLILVIGLNWMDVWWIAINDEMPILEIYMYVAIFHHPCYVNFVVALHFCLGARIAEVRFHEVNKLIVNASKSYFQHPPNDHAWTLMQNINGKFNHGWGISTRKFLRFDENRKSLIRTVRHVHLELMDLARSVDRMYGVQMILQLTSYFISFTGLLYDLYNLIVNASGVQHNKRNVRIFTTSIWATVTIINLAIINRRCAHVVAEAKRTGDVLHYIDDTTGDEELSDEIKQFSLQVLNDPLHFSPIGFFSLGYKFLQKFLGTVMTYLVILIQSNPGPMKF